MTPPITLQVRASTNEISLHEPVFIDCTLSNSSATAIQLDLGPGRVEAFRVTIAALADASVNELRRTCPGFAASGEIEIAPLAEHQESLLLQEWYRFASAGRYRITIAVLLEDARIGCAPFFIDVLPRDADRLRASCEALAARAVSGGVTADAIGAARALAYVADPIAVPFLERLFAGDSVIRRQAIEGLGRAGNEAARALLRPLARDSDKETAALARQALRGAGRGTVTD